MEDVCNDMKVVNEKNWKELALNRKAWNDVVEKCKQSYCKKKKRKNKKKRNRRGRGGG
jgi:hypothetical protein